MSHTTFLGGSFAAFVALVLFDAVTSGDRPREVFGVMLLDGDDITAQMREAFRAKHVKVDFQGFTVETLVQEIRPAMLARPQSQRHQEPLVPSDPSLPRLPDESAE